MDNFTFYSPTKFVFGKDTETQAPDLIREFGGTKVLVHYGSGSVIRSGLLDRVCASLDAAKMPYVTLGGVLPNPRDTKVYEGISLCQKEHVDFILAVGGGSVIDSSKAIAAGLCYEGDFWDLYDGTALPKTALPVGTILTIAAAGSEGSRSSVITREKDMLKRSTGGDVIRPRFSILNPSLTCTLPPYQTACGATDIMAHVLERYFTNTREVEVTDRLCEALLLTMRKEVPRVMTQPDHYDARANIMWAGMIAHNNIVGVGRSQDWNSHAIEHELSGLYDCAHGAGLAVVMPAWMEYVMSHDVMRFAQLATRVFGCAMDYFHPEETARAGIAAFRRFLASIGMPINFEQLGANPRDIPTLVANMHMKGPTGGFVSLTEKDVTAILELAASAR